KPSPQIDAIAPTTPHASGGETTPNETIDYLKSQSKQWMIQVGALESESEARARIELARNQARGLLGKADSFTEPVVAQDNRKLFPARFAGCERDQAEAICKTLKRADISCITVRN